MVRWHQKNMVGLGVDRNDRYGLGTMPSGEWQKNMEPWLSTGLRRQSKINSAAQRCALDF